MKKTVILLLLLALGLGGVFFLSEEEKDLLVEVGENQRVLTSEEIFSTEEAITFPTVVRSSGKKPVETEYTGIWLMDLFQTFDIESGGAQTVTFHASDGYRIMLSMDEVRVPGSVYLAFMRDGKPLPSRKRGGNGPYQLVIRTDPFSQRWIKHVERMVVE